MPIGVNHYLEQSDSQKGPHWKERNEEKSVRVSPPCDPPPPMVDKHCALCSIIGTNVGTLVCEWLFRPVGTDGVDRRQCQPLSRWGMWIDGTILRHRQVQLKDTWKECLFVPSGDCSRTHLLNPDDLRYSCDVNNCNYSKNVKQFITYSSIALRVARTQIKLLFRDVLTTDLGLNSKHIYWLSRQT